MAGSRSAERRNPARFVLQSSRSIPCPVGASRDQNAVQVIRLSRLLSRCLQCWWGGGWFGLEGLDTSRRIRPRFRSGWLYASAILAAIRCRKTSGVAASCDVTLCVAVIRMLCVDPDYDYARGSEPPQVHDARKVVGMERLGTRFWVARDPREIMPHRTRPHGMIMVLPRRTQPVVASS